MLAISVLDLFIERVRETGNTGKLSVWDATHLHSASDGLSSSFLVYKEIWVRETYWFVYITCLPLCPIHRWYGCIPTPSYRAYYLNCRDSCYWAPGVPGSIPGISQDGSHYKISASWGETSTLRKELTLVPNGIFIASMRSYGCDDTYPSLRWSKSMCAMVMCNNDLQDIHTGRKMCMTFFLISWWWEETAFLKRLFRCLNEIRLSLCASAP